MNNKDNRFLGIWVFGVIGLCCLFIVGTLTSRGTASAAVGVVVKGNCSSGTDYGSGCAIYTKAVSENIANGNTCRCQKDSASVTCSCYNNDGTDMVYGSCINGGCYCPNYYSPDDISSCAHEQDTGSCSADGSCSCEKNGFSKISGDCTPVVKYTCNGKESSSQWCLSSYSSYSSYTITIKLDNDDPSEFSCITGSGSDTSCEKELPILTKDGYKFLGWDESDGCDSPSTGMYELTTTTEASKLYPCFAIESGSDGDEDDESSSSSSSSSSSGSSNETITYTATFDGNNGTLNGSKNKSCEASSGGSCNISSLPTASRSGYVFNGWGSYSSCTSGNKNSLELNQSRTYYACWTSANGNNNVNNSNNTNNNKNEDVDKNPQTGNIVMFLVWILGIIMIGYSIYYFKELKDN